MPPLGQNALPKPIWLVGMKCFFPVCLLCVWSALKGFCPVCLCCGWSALKCFCPVCLCCGWSALKCFCPVCLFCGWSALKCVCASVGQCWSVFVQCVRGPGGRLPVSVVPGSESTVHQLPLHCAVITRRTLRQCAHCSTGQCMWREYCVCVCVKSEFETESDDI